VTGLIGHGAAIAALRDSVHSGRLHHAWLLAGPQGVGKGRFADLASRWLLATAADPTLRGNTLEVPENHPTLSLINAESHPDFRRLQRLPKDKTEELARSITVDQVRGLQRLFATTPSMSSRRVVVIDALDDLERNAANALLKNLEEPPADTIFLLVSHAPGRLLPTIRSRCRLVRFEPLDDADVAQVLRAELPESNAGEIATLTGLAAGAPGSALRFAGLDISGLDATIDRIALQGDASNALRSALARTLSGKTAQARYEAFLERAPSRIAAAAREGGDVAGKVALWREARDIADVAVRTSLDQQTTVFELAGLVAQLAQR
jgi:DNA polymerase-3 subunit delta'